MAKTILNVKTDKDVKERAQVVARDLGLPLSTVVNAFLRKFIKDREVTFSAPYRMTPYLENVIKKVHSDDEKGINGAGPFSTGEEVKKYLRSIRK